MAVKNKKLLKITAVLTGRRQIQKENSCFNLPDTLRENRLT